MSDAVVVPTVAQRLGIKVGARKRVRKPGPPRDLRHLMAAICYFALFIIMTSRVPDFGDLVAVAIFGVLTGLHLRHWARRTPMNGVDQVLALGHIVAQIILAMFHGGVN